MKNLIWNKLNKNKLKFKKDILEWLENEIKYYLLRVEEEKDNQKARDFYEYGLTPLYCARDAIKQEDFNFYHKGYDNKIHKGELID